VSLDWQQQHAAIWRPRKQSLRVVKHIDPIHLDSLLGVERQKQRLLNNTERFLKQQPANNALLWGSRGTGKSSLVKAVFNAFREQGLRLIEIDKLDLLDLPEIVDELRELPQRFIIFCDDLSFDEGDHGYRAMKSVLEGSIEQPPENVLVYATSNRRHLLPEYMKDNQESGIIEGQLHYSDTIEEKISLSDRFGLWLSFYPINQDAYLEIVDSLFPDYKGDKAQLHKAALQFAQEKGVRSGRTARQFFNDFG
jgi:predicted AAA+ superfamily ATPase